MRKLALTFFVLPLFACDQVKSQITARFHAVPPPPPVVEAVAPPPAPPPPSPPDDGLKVIEVTLHGPLEREVSAQVAPGTAPALALVMQRLTLWWMSPSDARNGDVLRALYELPPGHEPVVHVLRYTSQKLGKTMTAYLYKPEGATYGRYYTTDGEELEERLQDAPIQSYEQVTSFLKDGRHHNGVDFKCAVGTPVVMPFDGTVLRKNWNWHGNGNCIEVVDAKTGHHAKFLHLSPLPESLQAGQHYKRGQQVALTGNTGHTTAPHLHYQLESGSGAILDPFKVHPTFREHLPEAQLAAFKSTVATLDARLTK